MTKSSGVILNAAGGGPEGMSPMDGRNNLAPVLPDTSALDAPPVLLPYQQRWVADTSPLKVIEKSRRTGITWAEASDNVLTAASSAPAGGMNVYYIAYNQDMTVEYIQACAMWARAFNYAASEMKKDSGKRTTTTNTSGLTPSNFLTPAFVLLRSPAARLTCVAVRVLLLSTKRRSMSNWTNC